MYFQAVNHPGTILARQGLTSGIERVPGFFPCGMIVDRRRSWIFAILSFPKKKRLTFNNYKSRSIFNKILQKTKR